MKDNRKRAHTLIGGGAIVLLLTSTAATLLKGLPVLIWNAIYPVGVVVGVSCILIGALRLFRSSGQR
jgi:hypothetical protein